MIIICITHPQVDNHGRVTEDQPGDTRTVVGGQFAGVDDIFRIELSSSFRPDLGVVY